MVRFRGAIDSVENGINTDVLAGVLTCAVSASVRRWVSLHFSRNSTRSDDGSVCCYWLHQGQSRVRVLSLVNRETRWVCADVDV